jgi:hypothetical protein
MYALCLYSLYVTCYYSTEIKTRFPSFKDNNTSFEPALWQASFHQSYSFDPTLAPLVGAMPWNCVP